MPKILIIFGSKSDEFVYNNIVGVLKQHENLHYEMRICSAHRTPDELVKILDSTDAKVIIAGAGLAAHLPGVVASKTIFPIIGVPVSGNYQGLDALLSIMQMPPGIPVMSVGVDKADVAARMAASMLEEYNGITLIGDKGSSQVQKALKILDSFGMGYEFSDIPAAGSINVKFIDLGEQAQDSGNMIIYVPLLEKEDDRAEAAINILRNSANGLWVGLNRGDNAALAAIQIMAVKKYELREKLRQFRKKGAEKVISHDKEVRK
ncbi:hypothetical protein GF323_03090 [Candidatus Woesearchaeota archaeon]|nr:hypothetical protein [Candidatus Woesearchaeota archaeon]